MNIGERISTLRKEKRLTQESLAEMLDVTRQTISKWELDQSTPEIEYICKLSDIFEVTTDYLIKGVGEDAEATEKTAEPTAEQAKESQFYEAKNGTQKKDARTVGLVLTAVGGILLLGGIIGLILESDWSTFLLWGSALFIVAGLELMLIKKHAVPILLWSLWALTALPMSVLISIPFGAPGFNVAGILTTVDLVWLAVNIIVTAVYIVRRIRARKGQILY